MQYSISLLLACIIFLLPTFVSYAYEPLLITSEGTQTGNAVTYTFSGGRFGDNLVSYFHAKWIAMKCGLPLLYKPFLYSDLLELDTRDTRFSNAYKFKKKIGLHNEKDVKPSLVSTLFIIPYFPENKQELQDFRGEASFEIDWTDPVFMQEVIRCLTPKTPIPTLVLPSDRITIGVHVRRGGGYDHKNISLIAPLKCPPDSYYIESLGILFSLFPDEPLYVYILTDEVQPEELLKKYKACFAQNTLVEFDCRKGGNHHEANVLADFLTIPKFTCFIGSNSNFSLIAGKLGDYAVCITPLHSKKVKGTVIIDQIDVKFKPKNGIDLEK